MVPHFIGLTTDPTPTQLFKWVTGEAITFNGFAALRPDNFGGVEECVTAAMGGWDDQSCGYPANGTLPAVRVGSFGYVCESACGNGVVDPGEACDPPGVACTATCQTIAPCTEPGGITSPLNGHCYFPTASPISYASALAACPAGTHLATLNAPTETIAALKAIATDSWIALSAMSVTNAFKWDAGLEIFNARRYHYFLGSDPNQGAPACTVVTNTPPSGAPGWRDRSCDPAVDTYPALCERD
jgi:hypothetical protein